MAYQVLARKWRPKDFTQLIGQTHVVKALTHAFEQGRLHHAYLLTGTRGVGKTTIARIIAKSLNCEEVVITARPCNVCPTCTQIDTGRFIDLLEIDAASNTGIDHIREILDNAQYMPTSGRFKVYLIDEVHMLSKSAFNAMLKTLEEPPGHVKFILATTDPQKIPVTILSRCLQFSLRQILPQQIVNHLQYVLGQEDIPFEPNGLSLVAYAANGSMRDALSLLDQAIAYGAGKVEEAAVRAMLGAVDQSYLFEILLALIAKDGKRLIEAADTIASKGLSYDSALQEMAHLLHLIALAQQMPTALADSVPLRDEILSIAKIMGPEDTQLYYQIALHGRRDLPLAPDEYAGFTMTLFRMLAFVPLNSSMPLNLSEPHVESLTQPAQASPQTPQVYPEAPAPSSMVVKSADASMVENISSADVSTTGYTGANHSELSRWARNAETGAHVSVHEDFEYKATQSLPARDGCTEVSPVPIELQDTGRRSGQTSSTTAIEIDQQCSQSSHTVQTTFKSQGQSLIDTPPIEPSTPEVVNNKVVNNKFDGDWHGLVKQLKLGAASMLAQNAQMHAFQNDTFELLVRDEYKAVATRDYQEKLRKALTDYFSCPIQIKVNITQAVEDTPADRVLREHQSRQKEAEAAIEGDPFVQAVLHDFGGCVILGSVKPL